MFLKINHAVLICISFLVFAYPYGIIAENRKDNRSFGEEKNIIFISDTQSPLWIEELFLTSNNNEQARKNLFDHIIQVQPDAVFHLGDLVSLGFSNDSWQAIDEWLGQLYNINIPFYPTLGNHELLLFPQQGEYNFKSRFPFYSETGYIKIIGPIAFILLNSNINDLSDDEISRQQSWYKNKLAYLEHNPSIKGIIVGCHHPPFTNSKIVSPNKNVQKYFVPDFIKSKKSLLFLSGHSHSFEHFNLSSKDFLTIGGGGGLQHPLHFNEYALFKDLNRSKDESRNFHYLHFSVKDDGIQARIQMLSPDLSEILTVYQIGYNFKDRYIVETKYQDF